MKFVPMLTAATLLTATLADAGMPAGFNDQEDKVPAYVLPPLLKNDAKAADWPARRGRLGGGAVGEILAQVGEAQRVDSKFVRRECYPPDFLERTSGNATS